MDLPTEPAALLLHQRDPKQPAKCKLWQVGIGMDVVYTSSKDDPSEFRGFVQMNEFRCVNKHLVAKKSFQRYLSGTRSPINTVYTLDFAPDPGGRDRRAAPHVLARTGLIQSFRH
jgi:hypothetical protein